MILVVLLAVLGGGGFAAYKVFPEQVGGFVAEMMKPKPKEIITDIIDLDPINLPVFEGGTVRRFYVIQISLETYRDNGGSDSVRAQVPRIVDGFIKYLTALQERNLRPGFGNLDFMRERLVKVATEIVGPDKVKNVLFQNVFERPL
ncbi:MAG: hypothetical protein OHK0024_27810 [Thalassobaculales bacterium]